jgi:hypothetical protein
MYLFLIFSNLANNSSQPLYKSIDLFFISLKNFRFYLSKFINSPLGLINISILITSYLIYILIIIVSNIYLIKNYYSEKNNEWMKNYRFKKVINFEHVNKLLKNHGINFNIQLIISILKKDIKKSLNQLNYLYFYLFTNSKFSEMVLFIDIKYVKNNIIVNNNLVSEIYIDNNVKEFINALKIR